MEILEIALDRFMYHPNYTGGVLRISGARYETLEDAVRKEKVMHKTAIPAGRYRVVPWVFESRYQIRPLLQNVPNFTGVFIHVGNKPDDTSGCILVGKSSSHGTILDSNIGYAQMCGHLCNAWVKQKEVWLTVTDQEGHPWFDERAVA